jgi:uncharacterized membrane protein YvbJ
MVICPKCEKNNPDDAVYCNACASPIHKTEKPHASPQPKSQSEMDAPIVPPTKPNTALKVEIAVIISIIVIVLALAYLGHLA